MKFKVNENCIGCGLCTSACPAVFHMEDAGTAQAVREEVTEPLEQTALNAQEQCPVSAIESI